MRAAALVVREESLFKIPSEPDVGLIRLIYTSDDIDVEHSPCFAAVGSFAGHASPATEVAYSLASLSFQCGLPRVAR